MRGDRETERLENDRAVDGRGSDGSHADVGCRPSDQTSTPPSEMLDEAALALAVDAMVDEGAPAGTAS
jgi:hypothetical protein